MYFQNLETDKDPEIQEDTFTGFSFVYPFGCSLLLAAPSIPILTSGSTSYPINEVLMSLTETKRGGKLFVLGSWRIFSDGYIDKEENEKILDFVMRNLGGKDCDFEPTPVQ